MNEPRHSHPQARQQSPPHLRSSVRARRRGADAMDRTVKQILLPRRIVRRAVQSHSTSTLRANTHMWRNFATLVPAADRMAETYPRNRLLVREEQEVKQ